MPCTNLIDMVSSPIVVESSQTCMIFFEIEISELGPLGNLLSRIQGLHHVFFVFSIWQIA